MNHLVHVHTDRAFLLDSVVDYLSQAFERNEAGIVIARGAFRDALAGRLGARADLHLLDAEDTLHRFMVAGMPDWDRFREIVGGLIAEARLEHAGVSAYGEMVDVLWQRGEQDAAIRLEQFWNDLARLQTFSLLCAYHLDPLVESARGGGLERICGVHTHLVPARDHSRMDAAVGAAAEEVLERPLASVLLALAAQQRRATEMPLGQATLLWLSRNMPTAGAQVLERVRARLDPQAS